MVIPYTFIELHPLLPEVLINFKYTEIKIKAPSSNRDWSAQYCDKFSNRMGIVGGADNQV